MNRRQVLLVPVCLLLVIAVACDRATADDFPVKLIYDSGTLDVRIGERTVLMYHSATSQPPEGIDPIFARSGHIHPITTPRGHVVTAEFPEDHAHQHGLFSAWVNTQHAGRNIDFWNQAGGTGDVRSAELNKRLGTPHWSSFHALLEHVAKNDDGTVTPILFESWRVKVYDRSDIHLFDIVSTQWCVDPEPLHVLEYHYGGMAMRGPTAWLGEEPTTLVTNEGLTREPGNHSRPNWVAMSGELDGEACGIAVMQHPDNFRYPQPVRLHPDKPYFVYSPCVLGEFTIAAEDEYEPMVNRYRYVAFDGLVDDELLNELWQDFADPSTATAPGN